MKQQTAKKPDIRSEMLRQLTHAIQIRDVSGGLRLKSKAQDLFADRNDVQTGLFRYLEAKLIYMSGDYQKALASSRIAAAILAPFGETEDLAETFLLSGKALISLGNYREAEKDCLDAESLFRRSDNIDGRLDAVNQLARIYYTRAEYKNALKYLLEAVRLADIQGKKQQLAYLWGNLGRVYSRLGNLKKATESLQLNIEVSAELDDEREKAKATLSLGYVEMLSAHYENSGRLLDRAYLDLIRMGMRREVIIYQSYMGELKTRCGDLVSARRYLDEAIEGARKLAPESSLMISPICQLAQLELVGGNHTAASRVANKALAMANKIGEPKEKAKALSILAQIAAAKKQNTNRAAKKAADLFAQAFEILEEAGARFDKAELLVAMALCKLGSPRRRLANLFRAADIFKQLEVSVKYEETQELINLAEPYTAGKSTNHSDTISDNVPTIITGNSRMKRVIELIGQAAQSELPVLLIGETGTGKDLLAHYFHAMSGRSGEFIPVNCAAFPDTLLEAELFGYCKGAFTGANADKEGLLHRANGGTFFLDEIGEMSLLSQAKLLTVIETCRARRVGGTVEEKLDVRFIAATNSDLTAMVSKGLFRRDLYYRLSGICFEIPSLAERPEDIPLLLRHFLLKEGLIAEDQQVDQSLVSEFSVRSWPGNVRQLETEVRKLALFSAMAREDSLGDLASVITQTDRDNQTISLFNQVEQFEKALIIKALRRANGNKSQAARSLSIHESTLRAKMKRYDLHDTPDS